MSFDEDHCGARKVNAAGNLARLRKLTLNLPRHDQTSKDTMRGKRLVRDLGQAASTEPTAPTP